MTANNQNFWVTFNNVELHLMIRSHGVSHLLVGIFNNKVILTLQYQ